MKRLIGIFFAAAVTACGGAASAAVVNATTVSNVSLGTLDPSKIGTSRYTPSNALGAEDGEFFSLGLGGSASFGFGQTFSGTTEISISEETFGGIGFLSGYGEAIDIFASLGGGSSALVGRLTNLQARTGEVLSFSGTFDLLTFVDVTSEEFSDSPSPDGFDINSIALTSMPMPIPLPASGLVLLAGLGGLSLLRRR